MTHVLNYRTTNARGETVYYTLENLITGRSSDTVISSNNGVILDEEGKFKVNFLPGKYFLNNSQAEITVISLREKDCSKYVTA